MEVSMRKICMATVAVFALLPLMGCAADHCKQALPDALAVYNSDMPMLFPGAVVTDKTDFVTNVTVRVPGVTDVREQCTAGVTGTVTNPVTAEKIVVVTTLTYNLIPAGAKYLVTVTDTGTPQITYSGAQ